MPITLDQEAEKRVAGKRRQVYYRNRRQVEKMARQGSPLAVDRMLVGQLWVVLERDLVQLLRDLEGGSSPSLYGLARSVYDCYAEIMSRGEQLTLFPQVESPGGSDGQGRSSL